VPSGTRVSMSSDYLYIILYNYNNKPIYFNDNTPDKMSNII